MNGVTQKRVKQAVTPAPAETDRDRHKPMTVLVVEDEPLARARAVKLLKQERDVVVVDEASTGAEAIEKIELHRPDLMLIDIALPQLNAFEVLSVVDGPLPLVIFMTAFDQYAVRAFEVHAVDYLLKPIERARLAKAVSHARDRLAAREPGRGNDLMERLAPTGLLRNQRLVIRTGDRTHFVSPRDVDWIVAVGNYVKIHKGTESYLVRQTLATMENRLRGAGFVRIQRSIIVNARKITELARERKDVYVVVLSTGARFRLGDRFRDNLKVIFGDI